MNKDYSHETWFDFVKNNFDTFLSGLNLRALQIGVYRGDATEWLLENCNINLLIDVDVWGLIEIYENIDMNEIEKFYDSKFSNRENVQKCKGTSNQFFSNYSGRPFDFIYIDGDHSASQTALDGINAWNVLKINGIMAFDDYGLPPVSNQLSNPRPGIDCFLQLFDGNYETLEKGYQVWVKKLKS